MIQKISNEKLDDQALSDLRMWDGDKTETYFLSEMTGAQLDIYVNLGKKKKHDNCELLVGASYSTYVKDKRFFAYFFLNEEDKTKFIVKYM